MKNGLKYLGAPVAMSTPHYLDGFEGYNNKSGLIPDREKHGTIVDIEPVCCSCNS